MKKNIINRPLSLILLTALCLTACEKEIEIDYHQIDPLLTIEGQVTNEGTEVHITRTRNMEDPGQSGSLPGAQVTVTTSSGTTHTIAFDEAAGYYRSTLQGVAGECYRLQVDFEGQHYEGTSTMPRPSAITSTELLWQSILEERLLIYEVWALDPEPDSLNYYWYRLERRSSHPRLVGKKSLLRAFRWSVFDDRGFPPGLVFNDIICMSAKGAEKDDEDYWESMLYEGDTLSYRLMTIDRPTFEYFRSLTAGQSNGANPKSNLTGGCLGYFTAGSITRAADMVFSYDKIKDK